MVVRPSGNHGENASETLVRFIVAHALGVRVCCYDDRRGESRPDAVIHRSGGVPLEIVSDPLVAENQLLAALGKIHRRARFDGLSTGYKVLLTDKARVKNLDWLESTLRRLDDPNERDLVPTRTDAYTWIGPFPFVDKGEVLLATGSGGGRPDSEPTDIVTSASEILARKAYADVAAKLADFGGVERHAAVIVDEDKAPGFSWLRKVQITDLGDLPAPVLPTEITHLWVTPRFADGGLTLRWDSSLGWQGVEWAWGHPVEALRVWDDPICLTHLGAV